MNCNEANKISMNDFLRKHNLKYVRKSGQTTFYFSPFRNEKDPSFIVNGQNKWHDFGTGEHGDIIDFVMKWQNCNKSQALKFIGNTQCSFSFHEQEIIKESNIKIRHIKPIVKHKALLDYLESRAIKPFEKIKNEINEIWYTCDDRIYFGIGFKNDIGGYELRSLIYQGCIGKKVITTIINNANEIAVFEGFFDYLSFLILNWNTQPTDYLILNSINNFKQAILVLKKYTTIKAYLDNDDGGLKCLKDLEKVGFIIIDCSYKYRPYKDLNEYLINTKKDE